MAKFANFPFLLAVMSMLLTGCMRAQVSDYIKAEHPYTRKLYGEYDKIVVIVKDVLDRNGWAIRQETHPSVFERAAVDDKETAEDLLIFTEPKRHFRLLYSSLSHLNIFCRATAEGAEIELRYGKVTPLFLKQLQGTRNDKLAKRLLDQMEQELIDTK